MTTPRNNVISLLGVQGLSRNNYSVVQLKVVLTIIGHAQKVIKDYVVDGQMPNKSMRKRLTARQMADGYVVVVIRLSDLCAHTSRYSQVKNAIVDMAKRKPIAIPYKCDVNQVTYYAEFPRLFSCEFIRMGGHLAVEFRFSNDLLDYFYSFDKGVAHVNLDVVNHCCSASSIKLYIITLCWSLKGYTKIDPKKFVALMHGRSRLAVFPDGGRQDYGSSTPDVMDQALSTPMGGHPPVGLSSAVSILFSQNGAIDLPFPGRAWLKAE